MIIGHRQIRNIASFPVIPKTKLKISLKKSFGRTLFCILLQLAFILENHLFDCTLKDVVQNWNLARGPVIVQYYICFSSFICKKKKYKNDNFIENHNYLLLIVLRWKLSSPLVGSQGEHCPYTASLCCPTAFPWDPWLSPLCILLLLKWEKHLGPTCVECSAHLILAECWTYFFSPHLSSCARGWDTFPFAD